MRWPDNLAHPQPDRPWAILAGWAMVALTIVGAFVGCGAVAGSCPGGDCSGDYLIYESAGMLVGLAVLLVGGTISAVLLLFGHRHDGAAWVLVAGLAVLGLAALSSV